MGYILPVRSYEYDAYQQRMRMHEEDPISIDKTFPVLLNIQHHDTAKAYSDPASDYMTLPERRIESSENMYAILTGKGRNVNHSA